LKIFLDSIGCRLNQAEIEGYARQFHAAGHTLVATPEEADLAVINTCTVTSAADADSRGKIRRAARAGIDNVAVTGCWSTLKPEEAAALPGVSHLIPNLEKERLVSHLLQIELEPHEVEPVERQPVPGGRLRTRAFIKAQDGCNNRCTFCITTLARGGGRSRSIADILADIQAAYDLAGETNRANEVVLTGVHLGSWGQDLSPSIHLKRLVIAILDGSKVPRLRLSSLEPWDLEENFLELWGDSRLCRHLHLPLQSGSAATLRRMARKTTPRQYADLVAAAREAIPGVAVTTDVITGFPGESDAEFAESLAFVREMDFARGHVFTYSPRPGTAAASMPHQVSIEVRKDRNSQMRAAFAESARKYREIYIGQVLSVLWEKTSALGPDGWRMSGLTDNYLRVKAQAPQHLWNQVTPVMLTELTENGLSGQIQGW